MLDDVIAAIQARSPGLEEQRPGPHVIGTPAPPDRQMSTIWIGILVRRSVSSGPAWPRQPEIRDESGVAQAPHPGSSEATAAR